MADLNFAIQTKELLENGSIQNIVAYAQRVYPGECCGFILENGAIIPAQNIIETLLDKSLTRKNAFLIDPESWKVANANASRVVCIYHSHTNGIANMSEADRTMLRWKDLCYLVIGLIDTNPTSAKLFWWTDEDLNELDIKL